MPPSAKHDHLAKYDLLTSVFVTTEFIQFHRWAEAGKVFPARAYLEDLHRHKFHVRLEITVQHDDRELEYHQILDWLNDAIEYWSSYDWKVNESCEQMAMRLLTWTMGQWPNRPLYRVTVSEDGENGSTVEARA